jgi:hypothetical protein
MASKARATASIALNGSETANLSNSAVVIEGQKYDGEEGKVAKEVETPNDLLCRLQDNIKEPGRLLPKPSPECKNLCWDSVKRYSKLRFKVGGSTGMHEDLLQAVCDQLRCPPSELGKNKIASLAQTLNSLRHVFFCCVSKAVFMRSKMSG